MADVSPGLEAGEKQRESDDECSEPPRMRVTPKNEGRDRQREKREEERGPNADFALAPVFLVLGNARFD